MFSFDTRDNHDASAAFRAVEVTMTVARFMLLLGPPCSVIVHSITWSPWELFTATSPFANHQPTTVPVWAQNSSLHMTFTSENY